MSVRRKVVLYPVGIESSTGAQFGPISEDKSFEYIPIPEFPPEYLLDISRKYHISTDGLFEWPPQYKNFPAKAIKEVPGAKTWGDYLLNATWSCAVEDDGKRYTTPLPEWYPHYDPEFKTFTYGEGSLRKAKTLSRLRGGDLLLFYASLSPAVQREPPKKYVIGYFAVEKVFNFKPAVGGRECNIDQVPDELKYNAHLRETLLHTRAIARLLEREDLPATQKAAITIPNLNAVIAVGNPSNSRLLDRAIPLTDTNFCVYPELVEYLPWDFPTTRIHMGTRIFDRESQFDRWWRVVQDGGPEDLYAHGIN